MIWLTQQERLTLTVLGGLALTALGILLWQQRRAPLTIELGPSPSFDKAQDGALSPSTNAQDSALSSVEGLSEVEGAPSYLPAEAPARPPFHGAGGLAQAGAQWDAQLRDSKLVDLNQATAEELERLPEVGHVLAIRIIAYREARGPFRTPEDLRKVPGIGPKTYEALRDYVRVE